MIKKRVLINLQIKTDVDVVLSKRRARQIALLLGFASADQTRISTAVSEIARNALMHASGGRLDFCLLDSDSTCKLVVVLTDKGPGIANIDQILSGKTEHVGLVGARRLVDNLSVTNAEKGGGAIVQLEKSLLRQKPFSDKEVDELANSLTRILSTDPIDEIYQQNQELLEALDQLSRKQSELDVANSKLAGKNLALSELNQTTLGLNEELETKVRERTKELEDSIEFAVLARDEAIKANKLKSQFVANISHEIRTPMSSILSSLELALLDNLPEESHSLVEVAYSASTRLMMVLTDILDFSKLEFGHSQLVLSEFTLSDAVYQVTNDVSPSITQKGLALESDIDARLMGIKIIGDEVLVKKVLLNFIHNAIKFTTHGRIGVDVHLTSHANDLVSVRFNVVDTGVGIADSDKARLFHPFIQADASNTRRFGGTGLGLSISHGYVKLMNGQTGFDSTLGQGSHFWFEIPMRLI